MATRRRTRAVAGVMEGWLLPYGLQRGRSAPGVLTPVGTVGSPWRATVDERGLLTPRPGGWSVDWWIGADDRWHLPCREAVVRQRLVGGGPVVETAVRIPGGDAVQRVYAIHGDEDLAVVEVANRSPVPMAVAFAIRPLNPDGVSEVRRIELLDRTVWVDGRPALLLPRRPSVMAGSTFAGGDSASAVIEGRAGGSWPARLRCQVGLAQAAFVLPVPHGAVLRVAVPLAAGRRRRRVPAWPTSLPSGEEAARSWQAQSRRAMRLELPSGPWADAVEANRRFLLLSHTGDEVRAATSSEARFRFDDAQCLLGVLDQYGFHDEVAEVLRCYPRRQRFDGAFVGVGEQHACASALAAMAEHWRLTRDEELLRDLAPSAARGTRYLARRPGATAAERRRSRRGLIDGSFLLDAAGRGDDAARARGAATRLAGGLSAEESVEPVDGGVVDGGVADGGAAPSRREAWLLARHDVRAGDRRGLARLDLMVREASGTFCWPEGACVGAGFLDVVRHLLVREHDSDPALLLCSMLPDAWLGQGFEVHDAPTAHGLLSYAVRWHGERPALLWDLRPHRDTDVVRLTAPGLDPAWSTDAPRGEALLSAVASTGSFT